MQQTEIRSSSYATFRRNRLRIGTAVFHLKTQLVDLVAEALEAIAVHQNGDHDSEHGDHAQEQDLGHRGIKPGALTAEDDGLRVLCPPETVRHVDERDIEKRKNTEDCGKSGAALGVFEQTPQQQIGNIEQPEEKGCGQPRVPGPPNAPDRAGPQRAGDEPDRAAGYAQFCCGDTQPVPFEPACREIGDVGGENGGKSRERRYPGGKMKIKDALHGVHRPLLRRYKQSRIARKEDQDCRDHRHCRPAFHQLSFHSSTRKSHRSQEAVRNTISNPARNATQVGASTVCYASSSAVASTAAMSSGARIGSSRRGRSSSRMRAWAEMTENTVPVMTTPEVPRISTMISRPTTPAREML